MVSLNEMIVILFNRSTDMINTETENVMNENKGMKPKKMLKSALLIVILTVVFGAISYGFIKLNATVMHLSLPESFWCGLAMSLAVGYYILQKKPKNLTD